MIRWVIGLAAFLALAVAAWLSPVRPLEGAIGKGEAMTLHGKGHGKVKMPMGAKTMNQMARNMGGNMTRPPSPAKKAPAKAPKRSGKK